MGLARVAFSKKDWKTAEKFYGEVAAKSSAFTPEAVYWQGVSIYKDSGDHAILGKTAQALKERFAGDIWAEKSIPWLG